MHSSPKQNIGHPFTLVLFHICDSVVNLLNKHLVNFEKFVPPLKGQETKTEKIQTAININGAVKIKSFDDLLCKLRFHSKYILF